jgi:hypothetical protein
MKVNFLKRLESSVRPSPSPWSAPSPRSKTWKRGSSSSRSTTARPKTCKPTLFLMEGGRRRRTARSLPGGHKLKYRMEHMDVDRWLADLATDKQQLSCWPKARKASMPARDAKLAEAQAHHRAQGRHPSTNNRGEENRKVIVFCAFADTAAYLYEQLEDWARRRSGVHIALVSGGARPNRTTFGQAEFTRSSPTSPRAPSSAPR